MAVGRRHKGKSSAFAPLPNYKPITSQRVARRETSRFHAQLDAQGDAPDRSRYQTASAIVTSEAKVTSKFLFRTVTRLGLRPGKGRAALRTLEVGAINLQLSSCPYLAVDAIDLVSRNPSIREADFLELRPGDGASVPYQVLTLFMVLNCTKDDLARGQMLQLARQHLAVDGLLFVALPLRCFAGGDPAAFQEEFVPQLGFRLEAAERTPKIAMMCFRAAAAPAAWRQARFRGAAGFGAELR
jgi:hypothetical protein